MRQTDLCFEELVNLLKNPDPAYPECLIANEIGCIFRTGDKESEKILCDLLSAKEEKSRYAAYCFLNETNELDEKTRTKIQEFKANPINQELVVVAKAHMKTIKQTMN